MKLFYIPQSLRCPVCRAALWIEGEPTHDGRLFSKCIARGCRRHGVRMEVQLPHVEAQEIPEE